MDVKQMKEVKGRSCCTLQKVHQRVFFYFQAVSWDQTNPDIASGRKFKWLRERKGGSSPHTTLLMQIKNFILTSEVDITTLHHTLKRQASSGIPATPGIGR